jgi:hypothetical protein
MDKIKETLWFFAWWILLALGIQCTELAATAPFWIGCALNVPLATWAGWSYALLAAKRK